MKGNIVFRYQLLTAWESLICETVVRETNAGAVIRSYTDGKKQKRLSVGIDVVKRILKIVSEGKAVFAYNELEYPVMLDGVQQNFVFSTENRKKKFTAQNISAVHSTHAVFHDPETFYKVDRPEKAMEVVRLFEKVSEVLIEAGVNEKCLRLR